MDEQKEKFNKTGKTYAYLVGALVVLVIVVLGIYVYNNQNKKNRDNAQMSPKQEESNNAVLPEDSATPAAPGIGTKKLSYEDAIEAYPYRFQFSNCSGNPGTIAVKIGSIVMLDNRDKVAHTIKADGQTFKIPGYDYALLRTSVISNTNVTCDGGGSAMLNVQK